MSTLEQEPVWERQAALLRLGNNRELLQRIIGMYYDTFNESLSALQAALEEGNRDAVRSAAHGLKGASDSVGAARIRRLAQQLEQQSDALALAQLRDTSGQLQPAFAEFMTAVETES